MPTFYLIELFSGTGSFGAAAKLEARAKGYAFKNLSVDIHPKYHPSSCTDIMKWDYKRDVAGFLPERLSNSDVVWVHASPPCNEYSRAKTNSPRNLPRADAMVKRALKIINYVRPDFWTIENPVGL